MDRAIILDLDGTIITTRSGRIFPLHSEDWKFIDETLECILHHHKQGYKIVIVSNQGGIQEGFITDKLFVMKINNVCDKIEKYCKLPINSVHYRYCPFMESYNRKPNPGMAYDLAIDLELDLKNSIMVGDMDTDREFAFNAGIGKYLSVNEVKKVEWL